MTQFLSMLSSMTQALEQPCKLWTGRLDKDGYGRLPNKASDLVHRIAYLLEHGPESLPRGHEVDHLCRVRNCYEITHLEAVTAAENRRRAGAAKTHCAQGHSFTPENTRIQKRVNGQTRVCKICEATAQQRYWARKLQEVS